MQYDVCSGTICMSGYKIEIIKSFCDKKKKKKALGTSCLLSFSCHANIHVLYHQPLAIY